MIKIVGCICVVVACAYTGFFIGVIMQRRKNILLQLEGCAMQLRALVRHQRTPLPEALEKIGNGKNGPVGDMFRCMSRQMLEYGGTPTEQIWQANVEDYLHNSALEKEDRLALIRLGESIGSVDSRLQEEILEVYINQVGKTIGELSEEIKKKTGFYRMMGLLTGVFVSIVLI